jgi:hypothetical protein
MAHVHMLQRNIESVDISKYYIGYNIDKLVHETDIDVSTT